MSGPYKPNLLRINKYITYLNYFKEFIISKDLKSLRASINYVMSQKGAEEDYIATSTLGRFHIRKGTNDFQFINRTYEKKVKDFIQNNLNQFDIFIDVGACIGEYCIWLAKQGKKCIAIEPVNYDAIEKNISLNKMEGSIQLLKCGLGAKRERLYFFKHHDVTSSSYMERNSKNEPNTDVKTLDEIAKIIGIKPLDRVLIKLDVEGMEKEVLEGGKNFISNHQHLTFIYEDHVIENYANDKTLKSLANFKCSDIDGVNRLAVKL
jgi:FkbM family methyltransferase